MSEKNDTCLEFYPGAEYEFFLQAKLSEFLPKREIKRNNDGKVITKKTAGETEWCSEENQEQKFFISSHFKDPDILLWDALYRFDEDSNNKNCLYNTSFRANALVRYVLGSCEKITVGAKSQDESFKSAEEFYEKIKKDAMKLVENKKKVPRKSAFFQC